jgi:hypothetical protein
MLCLEELVENILSTFKATICSRHVPDGLVNTHQYLLYVLSHEYDLARRLQTLLRWQHVHQSVWYRPRTMCWEVFLIDRIAFVDTCGIMEGVMAGCSYQLSIAQWEAGGQHQQRRRHRRTQMHLLEDVKKVSSRISSEGKRSFHALRCAQKVFHGSFQVKVIKAEQTNWIIHRE